jgi:SAM-dependent methyltransferase
MSFPSERIISLYQRHAVEWDKERGSSLLEKAWLDRLLTLLPLRASILDIGCGSGEPIARYFIEKGCRVTGIDSSSALIDMCENRFPDQVWFVADMRTLSMDRPFDGILAWDSLFQCPVRSIARAQGIICGAGTAVTNKGTSKPSRVPRTVGLPDLVTANIQSRHPAAPVAIGVDDLDVAQVEDLAVLLRGMTGDHRFPRDVRLGNGVSQRLPP